MVQVPPIATPLPYADYLEEVVPNRAAGYTKRASGAFTAAVLQMPPASADGGLETTLIFEMGFDLPEFASFPLLDSAEGRDALRDYYGRYIDVAAELPAGAGVGCHRSDVHYIVTEYGIASLRGRTIQERAQMLLEAKELNEERGQLEAEIVELERQKAIYERDLDRYRTTVAYNN